MTLTQRKRPPAEKLTPDSLFVFASTYAATTAQSSRMFEFPTIKEAADHFGTSMKAIEETCEDHCEKGYLGLIVGFKNQSGYGAFNKRDRMVEASA